MENLSPFEQFNNTPNNRVARLTTWIDYLDKPCRLLALVRMDMYGTHMNNTRHVPDNEPDIEIANRTMNAIITKGGNLRALSEQTGISYSTLRRSLHQSRPDRRSFTVLQLYKIAAALNVPTSVLLPDELAARDAA